MTDEVIVPAAEAVPSTDATAAPEEPVKTDEVPVAEERTFTQKELDEIVQKRLAKESRKVERAVRAETELALIKQQLQQPQQAKPEGEPRQEDFKDYESWLEARTTYLVDQKLAAREREAQAQEHARQAKALADTAQTRLSKAAEKYDDFHEVALSDNVPIARPTAEAIARSEMGGDIAYYLGSHLDEAKRISQLDPYDQVREIVKLETKLATPAPKTSNAPAPTKPLNGGKPAHKDVSNMSMSEYKEYRKSQGARWA